MQKTFRERLEDYLIELEKELDAPRRYRDYVLMVYDKSETYEREICEEDFEKIKAVAHESYASAISTSKRLAQISSSIQDSLNELTNHAEKLYNLASELEKKAKD